MHWQSLILKPLSAMSIAQALNIKYDNNKIHEFSHPLQRSHWGTEQKLILGNKCTSHDNQASLISLQDAIIKAFEWNEELQSDKVPSIKALAEKESVTSAYIRRILRLAYLSPRILDNVFKGSNSTTLTLEDLRDFYPLHWEAQNNHLGIR